MPDVPYRFDRSDEAAALQTRFASLAAGEETGVSVSASTSTRTGTARPGLHSERNVSRSGIGRR